MTALLSPTVLGRSVRSRSVSVLVTTLSLGATLLLTIQVYKGMDTSIYDALPEGLRNAMGIPTGADPAVLGFSAVLGAMGSLALGAVAIAMGSGLLAGEESDGTLRLLLSTPMTRREIVVTKAVALMGLVIAMIVLLLALSALIPSALGVNQGDTHLAALCLHLGLNTAFYGFLALAVGAWTGRRGSASAAAALVMVLSYITVGLLPLFDATKDWVGVIPWNWFNGHTPLVNGVNGVDISRLGIGVVLLGILAILGFERRDLVTGETGTTTLDRLRSHPLTKRLGDQIGGQARVSSLPSKLATEHQGLLNITAGLMFAYMGVLIGVLWSFMEDVVKSAGDLLSPEMLAMFGGAPMNTPQGFYQTETLGLMAPIAVILVGTTVAVKGLAGHERAGRLGLALSYPVGRSRWLASVAGVMVGYVVVTAAATGAGMMLGSLLGGLGVNLMHIAGAMLHVTGLGLVYSAVALAIASATGNTEIATWGTVGLALIGHFWNAVLSISPTLSGWAKLSPFYYYLTGDPLVNGADWGYVGVLLVIAGCLVAAAFWLFNRRDLRR